MEANEILMNIRNRKKQERRRRITNDDWPDTLFTDFLDWLRVMIFRRLVMYHVLSVDLIEIPLSYPRNGGFILGVVSYPRSGNHLVRFLIEFSTSKSTQGSMGTVSDHALARNNYPLDPEVLNHAKLDEIVATKAHSLKEINFLRREYLVDFSGFLLIVRNTVDCILGNIPTKQILDIHELINKIDAEFEIWQGLIIRLIKTPIPVEIVNYSDLISDSEEAINNVIKSIDKLFRTEMEKNRFEELKSRFTEIREVSAGVKGRVWNGVRSLNKGPCYYLRNIDPEYRDDLRRNFLEKLETEGSWGSDPNSIDFVKEKEKFVRSEAISHLLKGWREELENLEL